MRRSDREVTDISRILEIIGGCRVFRLALSDGYQPYVIPLNFGFAYNDGSFTFYFHCAGEGKKLELLRKNSSVCFEMDCNHALTAGEDACEYGLNFSSVIGFGHAEILEDRKEKILGLTLLMKHQTGRDFVFSDSEASQVTVCKINVSEFSAKERRG
jgi:nitroimidazol reductase NimA-like FMN-containing flavoprotein (pyridoxamine 5'-phosphate oxidase superfamily)